MANNYIYGEGGKSGGGSSGDSNTLKTTASLRIIGLVSEGPIEGFTDSDPAKQIFANNVPLKDSAGNNNFTGISYTYRYGLPDQATIPGFYAGSSLVSLGDVDIKQNTPFQFTIGSYADAAIVTIALPALYDMRKQEKGMRKTTVAFNIKVKSASGSFIDIVTRTYSDQKCVSRFEEDFYVPLPAGGAPWTIKITRITPDASTEEEEKLQNKILAARYQPVIEGKFSYRNRAILGLEIDAEQFGSNVPTFKALVKGVKVWVPTNYDPITRVYATSGIGTTNGIWDGTFKSAWSNNPAWVLFDILTNNRYGLGDDFWPINNASQLVSGPVDALVNKWNLYAIAQYCDELVPDGYGGQEPRYTINAQISNRDDAFNVLASIVSTFRGMIYYAGGELIFTIDKDESPSFAITQTDVIDGLFTYSSTSQKVLNSVCAVKWSDNNNYGTETVEIYEDPELIATLGFKLAEVTAFGCTSRSLARRIAKWKILTEKQQGEIVTFSVGEIGAAMFPGAIIDIYDPYKSGVRAGGKVVSYTTGSTTVYVDQVHSSTLGASPVFSYIDTDGNPKSVSIVSVNSVNNSYILSSTINDIMDNSYFAISWASLKPQKYRIVSVSESESDTSYSYAVTALKHYPNKYDEIESNIYLEDEPTSLISRDTPQSPNSITVNSWYTDNLGAESSSRITVTWPSVTGTNLPKYELQLQTSTDAYYTVYTGTSVTWSSEVLTNDIDVQYMARVRVIDSLGRTSQWKESAPIIVSGNTSAPPPPTNLNYTNVGMVTELYWDNPDNSDYKQTIIYYNTVNNPATATIAAITSGETYSYAHEDYSTIYFWVKNESNSLVNNLSSISSGINVTPTPDNSIVVDLSQNTLVVPANSDGSSPILTNATTTVSIFEGGVDTSATWTITTSTGPGITGTLSGATYTVTGLTVDSSYVDFICSKSGYSNKTIRFSISKLKSTDLTYYEVEPSVGAINKNISGIYTPNTITFNAYSKTGASPRVAYSGRFIIATSTDGTTYTTRYTSSTNESTTTYTVPAGALYIKASLYLAGGTSTLIDMEVIPVVSDGATGSAGLNNAQIILYATNNSNSTPPILSTSGTATYTFATGLITGQPSGWTLNIPTSDSSHTYLWAAFAVASSTSSSDTILNSEWSTPILVGDNGFATAQAISNIANDSLLSRDEKPDFYRLWNSIISEYTVSGWVSTATNLGITTEVTAYQNAYNALNTYLTGLGLVAATPDYTTDTGIVRATFNQKFIDYNTASLALQAKINAVQKANNDNVTLSNSTKGLQNLNAGFDVYTNATGVPDYWNAWGSSNPTRVSDGAGGYACRINGSASAGVGQGIYFAQPCRTNAYIVKYIKFKLIAGTLQGATLYDPNGGHIYFANTPDAYGNTAGNGAIGQTYVFSKIVKAVNGQADIIIWASSDAWVLSAAGANNANTLEVYECGWRYATEAEIQANKALNDPLGTGVTLSAVITNEQTARVNGDTANASAITSASAKMNVRPNLMPYPIPLSGLGNDDPQSYGWQTNGYFIWVTQTDNNWAAPAYYTDRASDGNAQTRLNWFDLTPRVNIYPGAYVTVSYDAHFYNCTGRIQLEILNASGAHIAWSDQPGGVQMVEALSTRGAATFSFGSLSSYIAGGNYKIRVYFITDMPAAVSGQYQYMGWTKIKTEFGATATNFSMEGNNNVLQAQTSILQSAVANVKGELEAKIALTADANGTVTGIEIISVDGTNTPLSKIKFTAAKAEFSGDVLVDGTLTASKIVDNSINTSKITPNAATNILNTYTSGTLSCPPSVWTTIATLPITVDESGYKIKLDGDFLLDPPANQATTSDVRLIKEIAANPVWIPEQAEYWADETVYDPETNSYILETVYHPAVAAHWYTPPATTTILKQYNGLGEAIYAASAYRTVSNIAVHIQKTDTPEIGSPVYKLQVKQNSANNSIVKERELSAVIFKV